MLVANENTYYSSEGGIHNENQLNKGTKAIAILIWLFMLFWMIAGISAFVMSIVCFKFSGSIGEKVGGLLLSLIAGPFYWIYYYLSSTYCK